MTTFLDNTFDLRLITITGVEKLQLIADGSTAVVGGDQIGAGGFTRVAAFTGNTGSLIVRGDVIDLTGVSFLNWGADDTITLQGEPAGRRHAGWLEPERRDPGSGQFH